MIWCGYAPPPGSAAGERDGAAAHERPLPRARRGQGLIAPSAEPIGRGLSPGLTLEQYNFRTKIQNTVTERIRPRARPRPLRPRGRWPLPRLHGCLDKGPGSGDMWPGSIRAVPVRLTSIRPGPLPGQRWAPGMCARASCCYPRASFLRELSRCPWRTSVFSAKSRTCDRDWTELSRADVTAVRAVVPGRLPPLPRADRAHTAWMPHGCGSSGVSNQAASPRLSW